MGTYRVCCCFTRRFKVTEADPPLDVITAFNEYTDGAIHMTADQLLKFIHQNQNGNVSVNGNGVAVTKQDAERIVEQVLHKRHPITSLINRKTLTLEDFHHYLFSFEFNPPIGSQVHQDMNLPLTHYFIYTGHNSYLTGNQLSSPCSDVPIIKALERGVRVIELDLWPNSSKDNVHVLHGRTLTTPVELVKCLKSIKEHAFVASDFPVVITLEDHLTSDLQEKVAQMVHDTFGELLYIPESSDLKELPSPETLKGQILISTKPPKEYLEAEEDKSTKSQRVKYSSDDDVWGEEPSEATPYKDKNNKYESDESDHDNEDSEHYIKKADSCPAYKNLIAIHAGKPKGGLEEALKVEKDKVRRLSLAEQELEKAAERHQQLIIRFTQQNILRIYPKGTRVTSSNYKPLIGWLHGAQMIAFNMQGYGRSLWLMHGMFRANGGCGYVRKPDFLMQHGPNNEVFDPKARLPVKKILKVKVYMGDGWHLDFKQTHFDAYSPPDFYTRVGIAGAAADEIMRKTRAIEDSWTPVWNEEFTFELTLPEIALLRIEVHEYDMSEKDDFAGQTCLPVSELRPGIRAVPLCDRKGYPYPSARLLMKFEFLP
ncbi:putative phosphoinositide phospholipase C [Helianthus debilis subsp. tardiflorus]